jgi:hypothetical protein
MAFDRRTFDEALTTTMATSLPGDGVVVDSLQQLELLIFVEDLAGAALDLPPRLAHVDDAYGYYCRLTGAQ